MRKYENGWVWKWMSPWRARMETRRSKNQSGARRRGAPQLADRLMSTGRGGSFTWHPSHRARTLPLLLRFYPASQPTLRAVRALPTSAVRAGTSPSPSASRAADACRLWISQRGDEVKRASQLLDGKRALSRRLLTLLRYRRILFFLGCLWASAPNAKLLYI